MLLFEIPFFMLTYILFVLIVVVVYRRSSHCSYLFSSFCFLFILPRNLKITNLLNRPIFVEARTVLVLV